MAAALWIPAFAGMTGVEGGNDGITIGNDGVIIGNDGVIIGNDSAVIASLRPLRLRAKFIVSARANVSARLAVDRPRRGYGVV